MPRDWGELENKTDKWLSNFYDDDEADIYVYYEKKKKGGRVYDDGYMAWNMDYTYPERANGGWQVACKEDGELFWDKQRSVAMAHCERHIIRGHSTPEPIKEVHYDDPPF